MPSKGIKKILLVEDNCDHAELAVSSLQNFASGHSEKFRIKTVRTGEECLTALGKDIYDLVVLDYSLPRTTGLEVLDKIKEKGIKASVIIVTGRGSEQVAVEAIKMGASEYLVKDHGYLDRLPVVIYNGLKQREERLEKKRLEEELRRSQIELELSKRLACIGEMTARIAHEIRNPLAKISFGVDLLRKSFQGLNDSNIQIMDGIGDGVKNLNRIALELLNYAKPSPPSFAQLDIHRIIDASLEDLRGQISGYGIRVIKRYHKEKAVLRVDGFKIKQVFLNIIGNAIEAMTDGGSLTVTTEWVERKGKDCIGISFSDSGYGISNENIEKVFAPFFTTKTSGTGLGLSVVKKITELHNGNIKIQSKAGEGTTVSLWIPAG